MHLGQAEWLEMRQNGGQPAPVVANAKEEPLAAAERPAGRAQHVAGKMNGLEKRYAQHLELLKTVGEIADWRFEPMKLRLAPKTYFDVDFMVRVIDGDAHWIELHEVKGHWEDDARVKMKVAAAMFPWWAFKGVQWNKDAKDWKFEEFSA